MGRGDLSWGFGYSILSRICLAPTRKDSQSYHRAQSHLVFFGQLDVVYHWSFRETMHIHVIYFDYRQNNSSSLFLLWPHIPTQLLSEVCIFHF